MSMCSHIALLELWNPLFSQSRSHICTYPRCQRFHLLTVFLVSSISPCKYNSTKAQSRSHMSNKVEGKIYVSLMQGLSADQLLVYTRIKHTSYRRPFCFFWFSFIACFRFFFSFSFCKAACASGSFNNVRRFRCDS